MPGYLTRAAFTVLVSAAVQEEEKHAAALKQSRCGSNPQLLRFAVRRGAESNQGVVNPCT